MSLLRERRRCPLKSWGPFGGNDFWGNPQEGVAVFPGVGTLRIIFVRTQAPSNKQTAPSVGIQTPSFPSGFPPPRGIGDSPRIMHDKRGCDTHAYRGALTKFKRRALLAEIPARGEEFGARKLKPVSTRLYGVARLLGTQRARRDFQAAALPPVKVWLSGALFRLRKSEYGSRNAPNKLCSPCSPFYLGWSRAYTRLCLACDETEARKGLGHPYEQFSPTTVTSARACFFIRHRIGERARPVFRSIPGGLALILACGRELSCRRLARGSVTRTSNSTPPP